VIALIAAVSSLEPHRELSFVQNLPADVLGRLSEIIHYMQSRQYQRANDSYLRLSIGNAAWPIGVTMVGWVSRHVPKVV
jgi:pre-mRNA-splicing factor 18